jgi:hypothetical protein
VLLPEHVIMLPGSVTWSPASLRRLLGGVDAPAAGAGRGAAADPHIPV